MIPVNDPALYTEALRVLKSAVGNNYRGRAAQVFLACKYYGSTIPRIGSPVGVGSGELQKLLDDLYYKQSRTTADKIAIIFGNSHQIPSGIAAMGRGASNIWRNNLNLQKGFICFATAKELTNLTFRNQSRAHCPHLLPKPQHAGTLSALDHARCALKQSASGGKIPEYRKEDNPKIFRKDPATDEYTVYDPSDTSFYTSIIRPTNGNLIPIAALIVALYHDSHLAAGRVQVTISDFLMDFGFTPSEASSYFEDDPASPAHQALIAFRPSLGWQRALTASIQPPAPLPGQHATTASSNGQTGTSNALPALSSLGQTISPPPPTTSGWWNAQQAVRLTLEAAGWTVRDTSAQKGGCDFLITKGSTTKVVEVKSSIGRCSPTLTRTEHSRAKQMGKDFILAIVEDYDPLKPAQIQWVENPAALSLSKRSVLQYGLPRSVWIANTSKLP